MTEIVSASNKTIAIVGTGFSGAVCAVNILRLHRAGNLRLVLLDRSTRPGRGLAYRTWDDNLVLNVPAGNMSALADDADHFVRYCQHIDPAFNTGSFVSRRIYGDYLEWTLQHAIEQAAKHAVAGGTVSVERVYGEVLAVHPRPDGTVRLALAEGQSIDTQQVVLALGHFASANPRPASDFYASRAYIRNPWDGSVMERIGDHAAVAVLGAAHTAVDLLFRLTSQHDRQKIYLISRRGLMLQAHRPRPQSPTPAAFPAFFDGLPPTVRHYLRALRAEAKRNAAHGGDWRDVVNSLRPHTAEIWQSFPPAERQRFLSRVLPYWDIHRHRLAPTAHRRLSQLLQSGQVERIAGYVRAYRVERDADGENVVIEIRERGSGRIRHLSVGAVVNCTGPDYDIANIDSPLLMQLRNDGHVRQDALKLGFEVDAQYRLIAGDGVTAGNLFYVGPMLKARYWEAIAVPELRVHARNLALQLTTDRSAS